MDAVRKAVLVFLLTVPSSLFAGDIEIAENGTKIPLSQAQVDRLYGLVLRQVELMGLRPAFQPRMRIHLLTTKRVEQAWRECQQGGCGRVVAFVTAQGKLRKSRLVFLGLSSDHTDVWMDAIREDVLAQGILTSLDHANRFYLAPGQVATLVATACSAYRAEQHGRVAVAALRKGN